MSRTLRLKLRRDIARSWSLFAALVMTVLLGVGLFAASYDAYRDLAGSYDHAFAVQSFPDLFVTGGDVTAIARDAGATDGVAAVGARTVADLPMRVADPDGVTDAAVGRIVSCPATGVPPVASQTPITGAANPSSGAVLVEQHLAESSDLAPGTPWRSPGPSTGATDRPSPGHRGGADRPGDHGRGTPGHRGAHQR